MNRRTNRRQLLKNAALAGVGLWVADTCLKGSVLAIALAAAPCSLPAAETLAIVVEHESGNGGLVGAPASAEVVLSAELFQAAGQDRLRLLEVTPQGEKTSAIVAQFEPDADVPSRGTIWWLMPPGKVGPREFRLAAAESRPASLVELVHDEQTGGVDVSYEGKPLLRYNFKTVAPPEKMQEAKERNEYVRKYAVPRSDYIHPLYGPGGEVLTRDYPNDHPHQRGVYWAWSDLHYRGEKRSIHALQGVFPRPVGLQRAAGGPVYAIIEAENVWKWDDEEPIVREIAVIRAFPGPGGNRFVDFHFRFTALVDGLEILRGHCGGLLVRLAKLEDVTENVFEDPEGLPVRRCWGELSGTPARGKQPVGLAIVPRSTNPYHPNSCEASRHPFLQSTFPTRRIRKHPLPKGETLVLEYRVWIHPGKASEKELAQVWAAYNTSNQDAVKERPQ